MIIKFQEHAAGSARGGEGMAMAIKSTGERLKVGESNFKRQSNSRMFLWFVLINAGIVATISIWTQGDGAVLAPFILLLGLGGAFVTLWLSRWLVTRAHSLEIIRADDDEYAWLADDVAELSRKVGLKDVPNVGVWESDDANAFAAGSSPSKAVVAFSTQLLSRLNRDEIRAVAAHEIAHVANRDMLAMTLLQGVVNAFVLAVALPITAFRVVNFFSDRFSWGAEIGARVLKFVAVAFITFLGGLGVKAYSRRREFRADAMAANLVSRQHMKSALQAISKIPASQVPDSQTQFACLKIRVSKRALAEWFSTHPSIEKRINALDQAA